MPVVLFWLTAAQLSLLTAALALGVMWSLEERRCRTPIRSEKPRLRLLSGSRLPTHNQDREL